MSTGATQFAQVEQMVLRGVGFRWGCPSYFSGDGQDSFASVLVTGSPFVRITESRQEKFKGFCRKVAYRVLEFCEQSGRLPSGTCKRVRPVATARPVVIADEEKQARTFLSLYEKNCADPVEFIRKRGGDPKIVAANIAAWQKKFASQGSGDGSQGSGQESGISGQGSQAAEPTPAPPGSAGGDGSSPNDNPLGESIAEGHKPCACEEKTREAASYGVKQPGADTKKTGKFRDKNNHVYCLQDGKRVLCSELARALGKRGGPNLAHATSTGGGTSKSGGNTPKGSSSGIGGAAGGTPPSNPSGGGPPPPGVGLSDSQRHKAVARLIKTKTKPPGKGKQDIKKWRHDHLKN